MSKLQFIRGDSQNIEISFTEKGSLVNILGMTVFFTVKNETNINDVDDSNAIIQKTITTHTDPLQGKTTLSLTAAEMTIPCKSYVRDLQLVSGSQIRSTKYGSLDVSPDVTRSI